MYIYYWVKIEAFIYAYMCVCICKYKNMIGLVCWAYQPL